jgi:hypothetical protein
MGKEAQCTCRWDTRTSSGKALLETDEILFRGEFRLVIPLKEVESVQAVEGQLQIKSPRGMVALSLGPVVAKWAERILHPPGRIDKLGVKAGFRVAIIEVQDAGFNEELAGANAEIVTATRAAPSDLVFVAAESRTHLKKLSSIKLLIKPAGAIWVVYPKGMTTIREADVLAGGRDAGLVDVKVARFSERKTALKFVIPVAERPLKEKKSKDPNARTKTKVVAPLKGNHK